MTEDEEIAEILEGLSTLSPAGYAIGVHLQFTTSKYIFQHYSRAWMEEYSRNGFILSDPTVRWGVENTGWIRWSDLTPLDAAGVLAAAARFGLTYGVSVSVESDGTRSLGSFASSEKEFSDAEIAQLSAAMRRMHDITAGVETDSPADVRLRKLAASLGRR